MATTKFTTIFQHQQPSNDYSRVSSNGNESEHDDADKARRPVSRCTYSACRTDFPKIKRPPLPLDNTLGRKTIHPSYTTRHPSLNERSEAYRGLRQTAKYIGVNTPVSPP